MLIVTYYFSFITANHRTIVTSVSEKSDCLKIAGLGNHFAIQKILLL